MPASAILAFLRCGETEMQALLNRIKCFVLSFCKRIAIMKTAEKQGNDSFDKSEKNCIFEKTTAFTCIRQSFVLN